MQRTVPQRKKKPRNASRSLAEQVYSKLREMAISFELRPGERLNEITLAKQLGVSRTPVREVLNRLCSEGFLTFSTNQGFYRKPLDVKEIFDLYEFRQQLEIAGLKLAVERATQAQFDAIGEFLERSADESSTRTVLELVELDEKFHEQIMALSGNAEMLHSLRNINERIRYVRWVDMDSRRSATQGQHKAILQSLRELDAATAARLMGTHIGQRLDQITENIRKCYGMIYLSARQPLTSVADPA